jgi:choline-sulfatase
MNPTNTLIIVSDEHDPRYMGCSGHRFVKTPNLDRLAAGGTRFTRAWTPCPICVPARTSLATGRYVHEHGDWDNAIAYDGQPKGWGHRLQENGMRVESIGKLHYRNETDPTGFDRQHEPMHIMDGIGLLWGAVRDPLPEKAGRSPLFDELGPGTSSYNRYDRRIADLAIDWLGARAARPDPKPWSLFLGFVAPHMPLMVPQRYLDLYPRESIPLPKLLPRDGHARHPWVERLASHWDHDAALGTDDRRRLAIACYLGLITYLDEQVGRVLDTLDRLGLADSTRVIYTTDHGDNLGTRGLWNKCVMYRESTAVPMIVSGPGVPAGRVCKTNVSLVDLYPTILEAMGLDAAGDERDLPGRSLLSIAAAADDAERIGFSEYHAVGATSGAFMLTRGRFKLHYYVGFRPELFDIEADPEETRNLAADPAYAQLVADLEAALRSLVDPEATDRRAKDDQNALVARYGGSEKVRTLGNPGATPTPKQFQGGML